MTQVSICGADFLIDGEPTYKGREYGGTRIEGMLFNVRAVQATFDDANPETRKLWAYPDTGVWDPDRNVTELCEALPLWKQYGVLGFTVNFQGGGPNYTRGVYDVYDNNGFTPDGELKPAYADRMARVLARSDELGMVTMVGLFYWVFMNRFSGEEALMRACDEGLSFLESTGHRNILIELANEVDVVVRNTPFAVFGWDRVHELLLKLRADHPGLLYSTSGGGPHADTGAGIPSDPFIEVADYVLFHGNGTRPPQLDDAIKRILASPAYQANPKPLIINEDSPATGQIEVCWPQRVSWGYYDQGFSGQELGDPYLHYAPRPRGNEGPYEALCGFQTPPVNWGINTPFKRTFFERVAQITGYSGAQG